MIGKLLAINRADAQTHNRRDLAASVNRRSLSMATVSGNFFTDSLLQSNSSINAFIMHASGDILGVAFAGCL